MSRYQEPDGCAFLSGLIWVVIFISWVNNLIDLFACDFQAPIKDEVIHLTGVFIPFASIITCWF